MRVVVIADRKSCMAFALAGIETRVAESGSDAAAALKVAVDDENTGVVLITERLARSIRPQVDHVVFELERPLVVEIPDVQGPLPGRLKTRDRIVSIMG